MYATVFLGVKRALDLLQIKDTLHQCNIAFKKIFLIEGVQIMMRRFLFYHLVLSTKKDFEIV